MKKSMFLFLPVALLGIAASAAADTDYSKLSDEDQLSNDRPILSVAEAQQAVEHGVINCQTDNLVGSRIDKLTVCELAKTPLPTGSRYRFILTKDGLHPTFCSPGAGCMLPPSVASSLSSLQRVKLGLY